MARGNRRETIFHDDDDRRFFLHTPWPDMSSATHVSQQIRRLEKAGERGLIPEPRKAWIKTLDHL